MTLIKNSLCTLILVMSVHFAYSQNPGASKQPFNKNAQLPIDQEFKIGKLDNGMTYYIRKSTNPAGQAEFFIIHNVGSLQENDDQRGLENFLEHMAFNGTKNFPKKNLLNYFNSIGVQFGNNINAYTSMDRTVYNISAVPTQRSTVIDSALLAIHDWSYYISCEPAEIEAERGVIREEWRRGDDARTRMMKGVSKSEQTGSRFADRDVIGLMDVVNNFSPKTLTDFYHKWYRPDLQAIVVVGDINVNDIEQRIIKRFSSIPKAVNPAKRETYTIPDNVEPIVSLITDPESKSYSTRVIIKIPNLSSDEKQTNMLVYRDVIQNLICEIMRDRIAAAAESKDPPFRTSVPVFGQINYAKTTFVMTTMPHTCADITKATKGMLTELERLTYYGAEQAELETAVQREKIAFAKNYQKVKNPKNGERVNMVVENFTRDYPLVTPKEYYDLAKDCLDNITLEDLNSCIKEMLTKENRVIVIFMPESEKKYMPTKEDVLKIVSGIDGKNLDKFVPKSKRGFAFNQKLTPKAISSTRKLTNKDFTTPVYKQLDSTTEFTLANGTKIIWNEHRGNEKSVYMSAFRNGGYATDMNVMDIKFADKFGGLYSVDSLSRDELIKWMFKKSISVRLSSTMKYSEISCSFDPKSSEDFFQYLYTFMSNCTVDKNDFAKAVKSNIKSIEQGKSEATIYQDSVAKLRYLTDKDGADISKEYLNNATPEKLISAYNKLFKGINGYTFVFSGPMTSENARPLIEKYLSNIPATAEKVATNVSRYDERAKGDVSLRYEAKNQQSTKASVKRSYYSVMDYNTTNYLNSKFFSRIMSDRYMTSIREERGGTYYVGVSVDMIKNPKPIAECIIDFDTDPKLVDGLLEVVQNEMDKFVKEGPTDKEINAYKIYLRKKYAEKSKGEYSWITTITNSLMGFPRFDDQEEQLIDSINAQSIKKFAKDLTKEKNRMTFIFEPKK